MTLAAIIAITIVAPQARPMVGSLAVGDPAPHFKLKRVGKDEWFELKSNFGVKPTVLIFGSYT